MAIRADQVLMIGVVGIGLLAAYWLTQTTTEPQVPVPLPPQLPQLPPAPPLVPGSPPVFPQNLATGAMITLRPGQWYRGRLELAPTTTAADVRRFLELQGFDQTSVFSSDAEAENAGILPAARQDPAPSSRWFYGRYAAKRLGDANLVDVVPRPVAVTALYFAASPAAPRAFAAAGRPPGYAWLRAPMGA